MIIKKSRHEISIMKSAGAIVAEVHSAMKEAVKVGVSTFELDDIAEKIIIKNGALPTFKGYHGFPATICASINEEVVHGIPSKDRILKDGDIIAIDVGATYKGFVGDSAWTYAVGKITEEHQKLLEVTEKSLMKSIKKAVAGNTLYDVSAAVEDVGREAGIGIVFQYGGHGIGRKLHEDPFILNVRAEKSKAVKLRKGMTLAIEPMFNLGSAHVHTLPDNWTVVTNDGKYSAHFEHTIAITDKEALILTMN